MKLKLVFRELNLPLDVKINKYDDIITLHNGTIESESKNIYSINSLNINRAVYTKAYQRFLYDLENYKDLDKNISTIIIGHSNVFFNCVLVELIKWVESINLLKSKYIFDEIIFEDFMNSGEYIPFYESEGEINRGVLYKKYDFIPYNLYLIYKRQFKISIINHHSKPQLLFRIFFRRYVLLIAKFLVHLFNKFRSLHLEVSNIHAKNIRENHKLFISRGIAHTDFMKNYVNDPTNNVTILVGEGLFNFGKNLNKAKLYNLSNIFVEKHYISITYHIKALFEILSLLYKKKGNKFTVSFESFDINISSAITEFIIHHYDVLLHRSAVENVLAKMENLGIKKAALFTGEFYTCFAFIIGKLGQEKNINSFQLQNFVCDKIEDINFLTCKNILFHSKTEQECFSKNYPNLKDRLLFWGNIRYGKIKMVLQRPSKITTKRKILFFTQPIIHSYEQAQILSHLLLLKENGTIEELAIKIHPRENKSSFNDLEQKGVKVFTGLTIIDDILPQYDIAILQTSAVGQHLVLAGIPIIICQISASTKQVKADFINKDYFGAIENLNQITDRILNFNFLFDSFENFRKYYISQNYLDHNIDYFNQQFESYQR